MKASTKNILLLVAFAYIIQANINCAASVVAAAFIPLIGATWENKANPNNDTYSFFNISDTTNNATFEGNEGVINSLGEFTSLHFTGSFKNHDINFKFDSNAPDKANKRYEGKVNDSSTEMTLTSPDGLPQITLRKQ